MRPFQRKISILHTALDLIYTLDFLSDDDKAHIISLTPKNKPNAKPIIARMAFNRAQGLEGEIENKIFPGIEKLIGGEKSHGDICDAFVQNLFVSGSPVYWLSKYSCDDYAFDCNTILYTLN